MSARLLPYAVRQRRSLALVLAALLLDAGVQLLRPWPIAVLSDDVLGSAEISVPLREALLVLHLPATRETLLALVVVATIVIFLVSWLVGMVAAYVRIGFSQRMVYELATDLFESLQRLSLSFHSRARIGDSIRVATTDSHCVSTIVNDAAIPVISSSVLLASMFVVMWQLDWMLTLAALAVLPLLIETLRRYSGPIVDRGYERQESEARMFEVVEQTLSAIPVVHAFTAEDRADRQFQASTAAALRALLSVTTVKLKYDVFVGLATALGTAAILYIGARHVLEGSLSVGDVLVFLSYLGSLYSPLESVMHVSSTLQEAAGSARRVVSVLEAEREVTDRPGAPALPRLRGAVTLERVSFGYEPARPVLREVSLEVRPGETLAIVGPTGAGKSTLVSLVPRFIDPWRGRVLVDGRDVREVQVKSLREQVALVLQESFLFPLSLAENIAYGRPGATRGQIEAAARVANAHDFITQLPEGYDTVVGERGATLSGGERQRIAIARALLKDAPILILDEPTSALDAETEGQLMEALTRLMAGRTTLLVAHRLSTIRRAGRIVVLQAGRVIEVGSPAELLARDGLYAQLYRRQFGAAASA